MGCCSRHGGLFYVVGLRVRDGARQREGGSVTGVGGEQCRFSVL